MLRFRTLAKVSGFTLSYLGDARAISLAFLAAYRRLERVSGWHGRDFEVAIRPLPLTGDDRKFIVEWFKKC